MNLTEFAKKRLCFSITNPSKTIVAAWYLSTVLVGIAFIIACVSASNMAKQETGKAAGFAAVWTAILLIAISALGQYTMQKGLTPLSIGFFLGVLFIMVQQMLILFAIFVERSKIAGQSATVVSSQQAMATFSFFLFLIYTFFGSLLGVFRDDVLKKDDTNDMDAAVDDGEEVDGPDSAM